MTDIAPPTLASLFQALHAERVRTWSPAQLEANVTQRRRLETFADRTKFVRPGDSVPEFHLPTAGGGETSLGDLLREGPATLVFFRFAGCPACNIALPFYRDHLLPELRRLGASLAALTPQVPERSVEIQKRHGLGFPILTDVDSALACSFGIAFEPDEEALQRAQAAGRAPVRETTGAANDALPMPTVIVIGADRRVAFADVTPDWLARTEPGPVIAAVKALVRAPEPVAS